MEQLEGYVERITYRNAENGYTVMTLNIDGESVCVTGSLPELSEGEFVRVSGERIVHPVYGEQVKADALAFIAPRDLLQVERYLGSGAIKGVGPKVAACVLLFGFHRTEAFPVDVWMKKSLARRYPGGLDPAPFGRWAGYLQQCLFFSERNPAVHGGASERTFGKGVL